MESAPFLGGQSTFRFYSVDALNKQLFSSSCNKVRLAFIQ